MKTIATSATTTALALYLAGMNPHALAFSPIASPVTMSRVTTMTNNNNNNNPMMASGISSSPNILSMRMNNKDDNDSHDISPMREPINPKPVLQSFVEEYFMEDKSHMKIAAAAAMAFALAFLPINAADAAMSGGRMGGSYSAPRQSMSRPMPSSSRGYSGGGYYGGGGGYSRGYYSRPSTTIITPGFGYTPFFNPIVPFYGGAGVMSYSRGPSFFDILFIGGALFAVANIVSRATGDATSQSDMFDSVASSSALGSGTSVVQLSVALEVSNRDDPNSILGALDRLARTAKTDSRVGIQNLTSQVALELLRRRSSITSATSSYDHFRDRTKAGREFQSRSVKERSKFERESVSKYGGVDYSMDNNNNRPSGSSLVDGKATMAVVTIILNIDGDSTKIPKITSIADVESALRRIASDSKVDDCLQSVEILWTPEDRSETLSLRDVIADYPELRSV
eukprot:scaffold10490_cov129-Cylindrotheca_fusiformis.AAC.3